MVQEGFGGEHDERLAKRTQHVCAESVEVLSRSATLHNKHIDIIIAVLIKRIVFICELEKSFNAC